MADTEPLLFRTVLGTLRPLNGAAEDAVKSIGNGETGVLIEDGEPGPKAVAGMISVPPAAVQGAPPVNDPTATGASFWLVTVVVVVA